MKLSSGLMTSLSRQYAIPVIRHADSATLVRICHALIAGGMNILEIALTNDSAMRAIKEVAKEPGVVVGAGTLLTSADVKRARDNGAKFFVSPGLNESALEFAQREKLDFICGTMTPSEVMKVKSHDFEVAKVFPCGPLGGAEYVRLLTGPFPAMQWMPSGGISNEDLASYMKVPSVFCVGMGSALHPKTMIDSEDFAGITELAKQAMVAVQQGRSA